MRRILRDPCAGRVRHCAAGCGALDCRDVDPAVRSRSCIRSGRLHAGRCAAQHARSRAARRALGLPTLLARRASQHGRHRERRHGGRDRPRRGRHAHDPRRRGRHHAAESLAARRSRSSSARSSRCIRAASISASVARRARISSRCGRCAATRLPPSPFRRTCSSCRRFSDRRNRARPCKPCPAPGSTCRSGSWARACSARSSPRRSALPYAFASHFAPDALHDALAVYREQFRPSEQLDRPYAMVGVNVIAAETDAEARRLFTSVQQGFTNLLRGDARSAAAADRRHRDILVAVREGAGAADARAARSSARPLRFATASRASSS